MSLVAATGRPRGSSTSTRDGDGRGDSHNRAAAAWWGNDGRDRGGGWTFGRRGRSPGFRACGDVGGWNVCRCQPGRVHDGAGGSGNGCAAWHELGDSRDDCGRVDRDMRLRLVRWPGGRGHWGRRRAPSRRSRMTATALARRNCDSASRVRCNNLPRAGVRASGCDRADCGCGVGSHAFGGLARMRPASGTNRCPA